MAKRAQALYTITLVEVSYDHVAVETVPSLLRQTRTEQVRTMRGATTLTMRIGRHETRTALLVDVPAELRFDAERLMASGVEQVVGERYIVCERQRGRVIREARKTSRNRAA